MARSMSFLINKASTESTIPQVRITITESATGNLSFSITQEGGIVGDLRGLFFDLADKSLVGSLSTSTANTGFRQGTDAVKDLGEGVNMNGLTGSGKGFDAGIKIGTAGVGKDDIRSYDFTLSSSVRALSIDDFANVDFGVRLTSVGVLGGSRNDSSKIIETTSTGVNAIDDNSGVVVENNTASGNLFANDYSAAGSINTLTSWSGGAIGATVALSSDDADALAIGSVTLGSDGQWVVSADGAQADQLSANESITKTFTYTVKNALSDASDDWSSDTATFTIVINGENDGPVALDDVEAAIQEGQAIVNASVTANDSDVDRLDTHIWSLQDGTFVDAQGSQAKGTLVFNADGTWSYDSGDAYNYLNDGESVTLSFQYAMTDNHGAFSIATVSFAIEGKGSAPIVVPPLPANDFASWAQEISHFTLVFDTAAGDKTVQGSDGFYTVKFDFDPGVRDLDLIIKDVLAGLVANDPYVDSNTDLLGVVIKGGLQTTSFFSYGVHNTNGEAADVLPVGVGFWLDGTQAGEQNAPAIDVSYAAGFIY
ncbi:MAG: Ig-like domain-containing protein [Gammaproteobacteria bacterium]|nr:Ig-like domain-containing protein [Gammaproteobacteria bacterium]MDP2348222.1 Ig-like domain-containing protein [Gammaproteobacteria bacterium]